MKFFGFALSSFILFLVLLTACNTTEPPPDDRKLTLTFEDASCTEAWLALTTANLQFPASIILKQNDQIRKIINLVKADTLIYVDSLLPNNSYTFQAFVQSTNQTKVSSNEVTATTLDTTSHNFIWQTFSFGDIGSSTLYDVAIISENNIWGVGEIKIADSTENGYTIYNAVHWDGNKWTLYRIMFYTICGQQHQNAYPASSIIAFSETEIWVAMKGDQIAKIVNGIQTQTICLPWSFSINKIWGTNDNNLYVVGNNGNIAYYSSSQWTMLESGTTTNINDVWGIEDSFNNSKKIICAVSFVFQMGDNKILTIDNNNRVDSLKWDTGRRVQSVWSNNGRVVYTSGGGVFNNKSGIWKEEISVPLYYTNKIRGNALNDIFVGGDFGLLAHYNGASWKIFNEFQLLPAASFYSVALKGNVSAAAGFTGGKSLIVIGKIN